MASNLCVIYLFITLSLEYASAATQDSAVRALVYTDIDPTSFDKCIRLMNGTKQIGCQSSLSGNVGTLFHVNQSSDVQHLLSGHHSPYAALVHADVFDKDLVKTLQSSGKVNGIIVYFYKNYTGKPGGWSPAPQCPRYIYGLYNAEHGAQYANCSDPWNPPGDGLSEWDIEFPVFFMRNDTATLLILDCHDKHNIDGDYPLCAVQMSARMDGAVSTETCLRRNVLQNNLSPASYCQKMGGYNILATLQPTNSSSTTTSKPIVLVTAAMDSRSFVLQSSVPGANSATGFVTLLSVARALGSLSPDVKNAMPYNVMFVLFDGEAFDNMGSSRMVYDMSQDSFPSKATSGTSQPARFNLSDIAQVVEIGQVGLMNTTAWMHFDPISAQDPSVSIGKITDAFESFSDSSISFRNQTSTRGLVPSSLQSMLKERNVSGVVITDYDMEYSNKYYFSSFDTPDRLGVEVSNDMTESDAVQALIPLSEKISNVSTIIAKAVYKLASGGKTLDDLPGHSVEKIAEILYCYYYNDTCSLFLSLVDISQTKYTSLNSTVKRYVSVYSDKGLKNYAYMARNLLMQYIGHSLLINKTDQCNSPNSSDTVYSFVGFEVNDTRKCYRGTVYSIDGRSPSAVINNYDYATGRFSAWTESIWRTNNFQLSVFLIQDQVSQGMVLLSGLFMFFTSLVIVYIVTKKSDILFTAGDVL